MYWENPPPVSRAFSKQPKKERKSSARIKMITILTIIKRHCAEVIENRYRVLLRQAVLYSIRVVESSFYRSALEIWVSVFNGEVEVHEDKG